MLRDGACGRATASTRLGRTACSRADKVLPKCRNFRRRPASRVSLQSGRGAVRTFKVFNDGRRQITGFSLSGEFFGLETGNEHTLSAEAITNSKILSIKRSVLAVLAEHDKEIERRRLELAACELKRAQTHATLLILNAKERVAKFLLEMASRNPKGTKIELPMARLDIADYLGLTVETVSRVLGDLEAANIIARPTARHVVLRDRGKLSPTA